MTVHRSIDLTRRSLIKSTAAVAITGVTTRTALAQTPEASPVLDPASLQAISEALVGGGTIDANALPILTALISSDQSLVAALPELQALAEVNTQTVKDSSEDAQRLASNITQFWYVGRWDGNPVAERSDLFFSMVAWQSLPYVTIPTVCKGFGYWATEVALQ
jgi:hypothetical protein